MNRPLVLPKIAVVCGDPGGASAIAPVLKVFRERETVQVRLFAYREASKVWENFNMPFEIVKEDLTIDQAGDMLSEYQASLLLCGTSYNSVQLENRFIAATQKLNIPSLAVLDFWSNYVVRFQDASHKLTYRPDKIAVMDQLAFDEMSALGFDPQCLVITGQPAFDELASWRKHLTAARKKSNRDELNVPDDELLVLFGSQPLAAVFGSSRDDGPQFMGYDEFIVVEALLKTLENIVARRCQKITLLIRPHPRETTQWSSLLHSEQVRILVSSAMDRRDQAIAADLVVGMNSEMLVETCCAGCPTVSLQPGLILPDALPTNRSGLSIAVYNLDEITFTIEQFLFDRARYDKKQKELLEHVLDDGAAQRVAALAYKMASK